MIGSLQRPTATPTEKPRILLAEDDNELRNLLSFVLKEDGYDVVEARDGSELLDRLEYTTLRQDDVASYNLIISDIRMPGYSGLEILAALRSMLWHTPVILITGFGDQATHELATLLGARSVFDKPFDVDDLRAAVVKVLAGR
ncbi:MAG TPA: response regulator [Polyangiaceae bacterium]|jgi:CheY-like chemotaxis protein|nr:response regulator [Polyangiaceae bacterium]